jgi:hypothetical protein
MAAIIYMLHEFGILGDIQTLFKALIIFVLLMIVLRRS